MPTVSLPLCPPCRVDMKSKEESTLSHLFSQKKNNLKDCASSKEGQDCVTEAFRLILDAPKDQCTPAESWFLSCCLPGVTPAAHQARPAEQNHLRIRGKPHPELCKAHGKDVARVKTGFLHNLEVLNLPSRQDSKGELSQSTSNLPALFLPTFPI